MCQFSLILFIPKMFGSESNFEDPHFPQRKIPLLIQANKIGFPTFYERITTGKARSIAFFIK
jgi:hypothetical protein